MISSSLASTQQTGSVAGRATTPKARTTKEAV